MIGLSLLSSVSKHNIWSYYDWVVVVVIVWLLALQSLLQKLVECSELTRDLRGRDRVVVGFTIFVTETRGML
jgi:hypothetical protein